jgi:uncharacterized protein YdbL (DUF1318 family)
MTSRRLVLPLALLAAATTACVTIQVYFPAARIQNLSEQIEAEVERKAGESLEVTPAPEATPPAVTPPPPRAHLGLVETLLGFQVLHAAEDVPAPEVSSPAIRAIIDSRAARVAELNRYKSQGLVGEGNDALLKARGLESVTDLALRAAVQRLIDAENKDRRLLFEEIATAEGVDRAQIPRIQTTYAQTLRRHARPGDWVQSPDGSWSQA